MISGNASSQRFTFSHSCSCPIGHEIARNILCFSYEFESLYNLEVSKSVPFRLKGSRKIIMSPKFYHENASCTSNHHLVLLAFTDFFLSTKNKLYTDIQKKRCLNLLEFQEIFRSDQDETLYEVKVPDGFWLNILSCRDV